jgi:nucleotide-binding universal stress UspA family protein
MHEWNLDMLMSTSTVPITSEISLRSVLWATDLSSCSEKALHHATDVARHFGAKLYLMHVVSSLGFTLAGPDSTVYACDVAVRDLRSLERDLLVQGAIAGVEHEVIVADGDVWESIGGVSLQKKVGLIVIGTHSRTGFARLVLGSTAEEIFRKASCPVLTVGPNCPNHVQLADDEQGPPILFPTDFSAESLNGLPYALSLANEQGTRLILQHVIEPSPDFLGGSRYSANDVIRLRSQQKHRAFERLHSVVGTRKMALQPLYMVQFGDAADVILSTAERLQTKTIVMGLKPKEYVEVVSHLAWSVASRVVSESRCPVLTVRA